MIELLVNNKLQTAWKVKDWVEFRKYSCIWISHRKWKIL